MELLGKDSGEPAGESVRTNGSKAIRFRSVLRLFTFNSPPPHVPCNGFLFALVLLLLLHPLPERSSHHVLQCGKSLRYIGEIVPKVIALNEPESISLKVAKSMLILSKVSKPF